MDKTLVVLLLGIVAVLALSALVPMTEEVTETGPSTPLIMIETINFLLPYAFLGACVSFLLGFLITCWERLQERLDDRKILSG